MRRIVSSGFDVYKHMSVVEYLPWWMDKTTIRLKVKQSIQSIYYNERWMLRWGLNNFRNWPVWGWENIIKSNQTKQLQTKEVRFMTEIWTCALQSPKLSLVYLKRYPVEISCKQTKVMFTFSVADQNRLCVAWGQTNVLNFHVLPHKTFAKPMLWTFWKLHCLHPCLLASSLLLPYVCWRITATWRSVEKNTKKYLTVTNSNATKFTSWKLINADIFIDHKANIL